MIKWDHLELKSVSDKIIAKAGEIVFIELVATNLKSFPLTLTSVKVYNEESGDWFDNFQCESVIQNDGVSHPLYIPMQAPENPKVLVSQITCKLSKLIILILELRK